MHPETSLEAYERVSPDMLCDHYKIILKALGELKIAIAEEIAAHIKAADKNMVSRRMKELEGLGYVFKPGTKKLTKSGRNAFQYSLTGTEVTIFTLPERYVKGETTAADYASQIIAKTKSGKAIQADLFNNQK